MRTPGCPVWAVAVGLEDTLIAAAGEDEFVRLYDLDSGDLIEEKAAHRDWIRALSFAGDTLITGIGRRVRAHVEGLRPGTHPGPGDRDRGAGPRRGHVPASRPDRGRR